MRNVDKGFVLQDDADCTAPIILKETNDFRALRYREFSDDERPAGSGQIASARA